MAITLTSPLLLAVLTSSFLVSSGPLLAQPSPWERALGPQSGAVVTSPFGNVVRAAPGYCDPGDDDDLCRTHSGVDVAFPGHQVCSSATDSPGNTKYVYPVTRGVVAARASCLDEDDLGNVVVIRGDDGIYWYYGHLRDLSHTPAVGLPVSTTTKIGIVGKTGFATGCHLHLERRRFGPQGDPTTCDSVRPPAVACRPGTLYQRLDGRADVSEHPCFLRAYESPELPLLGEFSASAPRPPGFNQGPAINDAGVDLAWLGRFRGAVQRHTALDFDSGVYPGQPTTDQGGGSRVHLWARYGVSTLNQGVLIQDLLATTYGYDHGRTAIVANPWLGDAFLLKQGMWNVAMNHGLPWNLGSPRTEERPATHRVNATVRSGVEQVFERGTLFWADKLYLQEPDYTVDQVAILVGGVARRIHRNVSIRVAHGSSVEIMNQKNPYCVAPCYDLGVVTGFVYELRSGAPLVAAAWSDTQSAKGAASPDLAADGQTFSFQGGSGSTLLLTLRDIMRSGFE